MQIVFLNGLPRSGKDTLVGMMERHGRTVGLTVGAISSIDPVREMLRHVNIDVDDKTPELRAAMSEVGDSLETHLGFRSKWCLRQAHYADLRGTHIFVIHMREPDLIEKTADLFEADGYQVRKAFLESERAERVTSNASDLGVWREGFYDKLLENHGPLSDLEEVAKSFLRELKPGLTKRLS